MDEDVYDDLWEIEWVRIPDVPFVSKFKFEEDSYRILISDLSEIYGEKLVETEVQERFCILNPYAEMKSKVILKHVKQSLDDSLKTKIKLQHTSQAITIRLQFSVSEVLFIFDIKSQLLPCEKLRTHLIAPTVLAALSVHQENVLLKQKIKDMEKDKSVLSMQTQLCTNSSVKRMVSDTGDLIPLKRERFPFKATHVTVLEQYYEKDPSQTIKQIADECNKTVERSDIKGEQTRTFGNCRIHKRSKILVGDVLESFLNLQKTIQSCISESKVLTGDASTTSTSTYTNPRKETVKDQFCTASSLKYEDMEGNSTSTPEQDSYASNDLQQSEMSSLPVKREIEDSSKTEIDSSLQPQLHAKLKKKKCLKF